MSDNINITFKCENCGADPATLVGPDNTTDDDIVKCKGCGFEFGRFGDVKTKARDAAVSEVEGMMKDAFKGLKGWKMK